MMEKSSVGMRENDAVFVASLDDRLVRQSAFGTCNVRDPTLWNIERIGNTMFKNVNCE